MQTAAAIAIKAIATTAIRRWLGFFAIVPILYYYFFLIAYNECPADWNAWVASRPAHSIILDTPPGCCYK